MCSSSKMCILCLEPNVNCIDIFTDDGQSEIAEVLTDHFWFNIDELMQYPETICVTCWEQSKAFNRFYRHVQEKHLNYLINRDDEQQSNIVQQSVFVESLQGVKTEQCDDEIEPLSETVDYPYDVNDADNANETDDVDDPDFDDDLDFRAKPSKPTKRKRHTKSSGGNRRKSVKREAIEVNECAAETSEATQPDADFPQELIEKMLTVFDMGCDFCNHSFESWADARAHYPREHNLLKGYLKCCNKKYRIRSSIIDHIKYHIDPTEFQCATCSKQFPEKRALASHSLIHLNTEDLPYECYYCHKRYTRKHIMKQHFERAHPLTTIKFTCDICNKNFKSVHILKYHKLRVHEGSEQRVCDICAKVFKTKEGYQSHLATHMGVKEPRAQCTLCGVWLKTKKILQKHMKMHTDTPEKCPYCEKIKPNRSSMTHHIHAVHSDAKYTCTICDKAFKRMLSLTEHIASHTGENLYTCTYCPKMFKSNANMHKHRKKEHYDRWVADRVARNIARTTNTEQE